MTTTIQQLRHTHPLDPITPGGVEELRRVAVAAGLVADSTRFVYVGLQEPAKAEVLSHQAGRPGTRSFRVLLLDLATQVSRDVVGAAAAGTVVSVVELATATAGQLPVLDEEFELVEQLL